MKNRWSIGLLVLVVSPSLGVEAEVLFADGFEGASICAWSNLWYIDGDGDSWGDSFASGVGVSCPEPPGLAPNNGDCDDGEPSINPAASEACNGLDDDCDGISDNGPYEDAVEPNENCAQVTTLTSIGSNELIERVDLSLYGSGDHDIFVIPAAETDSSCSCCDAFCLDEDFQLKITLTAPAGSGSYMFCSGKTCAGVDDNCQEVVAGQSSTWTWTIDGSCTATDGGDFYVHIHGLSQPGFSCSPYTLSYEFLTGCF